MQEQILKYGDIVMGPNWFFTMDPLDDEIVPIRIDADHVFPDDQSELYNTTFKVTLVKMKYDSLAAKFKPVLSEHTALGFEQYRSYWSDLFKILKEHNPHIQCKPGWEDDIESTT